MSITLTKSLISCRQIFCLKIAISKNIHTRKCKSSCPNISNAYFDYDDDGYVQVYTDGACEHNGKANAKAGIGVFFKEGHPLNVSQACRGRATNNSGEIQAAIKAVKLVKSCGERKLCIHTDSQFLINSMTLWLSGWIQKGWRLANGAPVKNKLDFEKLHKETLNMDMKWIYVKAHSGNYGNEKADELARKGAEKYKIKIRKCSLK